MEEGGRNAHGHLAPPTTSRRVESSADLSTLPWMTKHPLGLFTFRLKECSTTTIGRGFSWTRRKAKGREEEARADKTPGGRDQGPMLARGGAPIHSLLLQFVSFVSTQTRLWGLHRFSIVQHTCYVHDLALCLLLHVSLL